MEFLVQLYIGLVLAGLILIGAEIFTPGAILGIMGAMSLVAAAIIAFPAFGNTGGFISALGILIGVGVAMVLWIKIFPRSSIGQRMMIKTDLASANASAEDNTHTLVGKTGQATSDLRPAGFATIEGQRMDVVSRGELIPKGASITVVQVEGNRIVVKKT